MKCCDFAEETEVTGCDYEKAEIGDRRDQQETDSGDLESCSEETRETGFVYEKTEIQETHVDHQETHSGDLEKE